MPIMDEQERRHVRAGRDTDGGAVEPVTAPRPYRPHRRRELPAQASTAGRHLSEGARWRCTLEVT